MSRGKGKSYLVVHGHFYQPPRENPWTAEVEREVGASPYHDWNQRIADQCYRPNSAARLVNEEGRILEIVNNYSLTSFNFGPTLLSWLQRNDPITYARLLEADQESLHSHSGHGNALAQVYTHLIMPLATYRDKSTQVRWGIKDFIFRFGRKPEGMWLPEAAVDRETLSVLAQNGIKFTILAPQQAKRVRRIGGKRWRKVTLESVDTTRVYRCFLKKNYIDIFFFNHPFSLELSFGDLLRDGKLFTQRLPAALKPRATNNQLILLATDGETFGHHKPFGEMALAYVLAKAAPQLGLKVTNLGEFIAENPPQWEVEIDEGPRGEGSSWSCSHGVERWKGDCGCSTGGQPHWNQRWRKPLRQALEWLGEKLQVIYENQTKGYFKDVWWARDEYIDVILDRSPKCVDRFFKKVQCFPLNDDEKVECLKLLEMQRNSMLMFTSCGWFFADISGLETVQILKYAARAIELARCFSKEDLEGTFLKLLQKARSNIRKYGNGKGIYCKFVKPKAVSAKLVMANYSMHLPFQRGKGKMAQPYSYQITDAKGEIKRRRGEIFSWGKASLENIFTQERGDFLYLSHFQSQGRLDCWVKECPGLLPSPSSHLEELISQVETEMGWEHFTLEGLPGEWKGKILRAMKEMMLQEVSRKWRGIYQNNLALMIYLEERGEAIPQALKQLFSFLITQEIEEGLRGMRKGFEKNYKFVNELHSELDIIGLPLVDKRKLELLLSDLILEETEFLCKRVSEEEVIKVNMLLDLAVNWGLKPDLRGAQESFYPLWKELARRRRGSRAINVSLRKLAERLGFSV